MDDELTSTKVAALAVSTSHRTMTARLVGVGAEGADDQAEVFEDAEVAQPAGLMARPTLTDATEAFAVQRGDEMLALLLIDKSRPPQAVEDGETRVYGVGANNSATVIRLRADKSIEITSDGADVVVNGGTLKVALVTNGINVGTLAGTAGPYPVTFTFTPQDADGVPGAPSVGPTAALAGVIARAGGSARFKG